MLLLPSLSEPRGCKGPCNHPLWHSLVPGLGTGLFPTLLQSPSFQACSPWPAPPAWLDRPCSRAGATWDPARHPAELFSRDLLAVLLVFPLPRAPWPQPSALPHARTAGRSCSPRVVLPGMICTSLLFICVLQAPCASRSLVYTRNPHKSRPKDAASRQSPVASLSRKGGTRTRLELRAPGAAGSPSSSPSPGWSWLWAGTQGCSGDGNLPSWDAA